MTTEVHDLVLIKHMQRARDDSVSPQQEKIIEIVTQSGIRMTGWELTANLIGIGASNGGRGMDYGWTRKGEAPDYTYEMYLTLSFKHETKKPADGAFETILNTVARQARANNQGRWELITVDGEEFEEKAISETFVSVKGDSIEYAKVELPDNLLDNFTNHLYGLDWNLELMHDALLRGYNTRWDKRFNCALIGPPGCGKSDICTTLRQTLGDDAVWELDAVATTKAGAIKVLAERDVLPRIVVIEELEKCPTDDALSFLLSILDIRSAIRKVTARGNVEMEAKLFAVCTVNDEEKFLKMASGALADRFPTKIYFERPDRAMLARILKREIDEVDGSYEWIKPCLDYCESAIGTDGNIGVTSPRQVIAWCLTGGEKWVTGRFQEILNHTQKSRVAYHEDWSREDGS